MMKSPFDIEHSGMNRIRRQYGGRTKRPIFQKPFLFIIMMLSVFILYKKTSSQPFILTSSGFENGQTIPMKFARDGDNLNPPLSWSGAPSNTASFALIMDDPDAPTKEPWVHWVMYNLPPTLTSLPQGVTTLPTPSQLGLNTWNLQKYDGPQPPKNQQHLYILTLYALDMMLFVDDESSSPPPKTKEDLLNAMSGHVVAEAKWTGRFQS